MYCLIKTKKNMSTNEIDSDIIQFIIKPSQIVNIGWLILLLGSIFLMTIDPIYWWVSVLFAIIWFIKWLIIKCWSFYFCEKTISERKGVLSTLTREIHYFRIKSVRWEQPFWLRIFGLSNVVLITSDPLIPVLRLYAVEEGSDIRDHIKAEAARWRRTSNVKEQDIHPLM